MGERMECFGCGSETSSVLWAWEHAEPCPYCGLSAEAGLEILAIKASRANAELRDRAADLVKELDEWKRKARAAEGALAKIRTTVDSHRKGRA